jgi:hypothetical protein
MAIGPPEPIDTSNRPGHVAPTREAVALRQSRIDNRDVSRMIAHARNRDKVPHDKAQAIRESAAVCKSEVPTLLQGDQGASEDMRRSLPPSPQTSKRQTASDGHPSRDAEPEAAQTTSRTAAKSLTPLPCRGTLPLADAVGDSPMAPGTGPQRGHVRPKPLRVHPPERFFFACQVPIFRKTAARALSA